jgi:hypothetical protein
MDIETRMRWNEYSRAKDAMFEATDTEHSPWWVVNSVDQKKARLNCISHLLSQMPYEEVEHPTIVLPPREHHDDYVRHAVPQEIHVPQVY